MRILHWEEMFHPSFGYQVNVLAKFQAKQGHEVIILSSENIEKHPLFAGFENTDNIGKEDELYSKKYGVTIIRLPIHKVISGRVIYKKGYIEKIKALRPDVILCHYNDTLSAMTIIKRYKSINIPIVFDSHMLEMASRNPLRSLFRSYYRNFITPIIVKNRWTVIRTQDDNYVNRCLGIPEDQTPFISFGTDTSIFFPDNEVKLRFRNKYGISSDDFVVVYTGKLGEAKGGKLLAKAFIEEFNVNKKIVLIVVGNTKGDDYGNEVEELFSKSKNRIIRFPTQKYTDLPQFYQAADLSVFPKQCSLSFYDAQACGLPVIAEDNNINIDRLKHGNGFTFKAGDINDFREKILKCVDMDETEFKQMKKNAYNYVRDNYDYKNIAEQYTNILVNEYKKYQRKG